MTLQEAIARQEGFYVTGSRAQRNNNPGNLEYHTWMHNWGGTLETEGYRFAKFPSSEIGFAVLKALLQEKPYKGKTVAEAIEIYAPSNENATQNYIKNVCTWLKVTPDTVIDGLLG